MWWHFQNKEQFGEKKDVLGSRLRDHFEEGGAESRAGNTCVRVFMWWMLAATLRVDKLAWKSVESKNRKVTRTISGWPIFKSKKKSWGQPSGSVG